MAFYVSRFPTLWHEAVQVTIAAFPELVSIFIITGPASKGLRAS